MRPWCGRTSTSPAQEGTRKGAIGRSRAGSSNRIHTAVDVLGNPLRLILTAGRNHEATQACALIDGSTLVNRTAEEGDDGDFRGHLAEPEVDAVIPPLGSYRVDLAHDRNANGLKYRVERLLACLAYAPDPAITTHSCTAMIRARLSAIACGYEDCDDLDVVRFDPAFD